MGMFDEVVCNHELFGEHRGEKHQTKDLHWLGGALDLYEITPLGRLEFVEYTVEDRGKPGPMGVDRLFGSMTTVLAGARRDVNYHGWLYLSCFGRAKFTDGTLVAFEAEAEETAESQGGRSKFIDGTLAAFEPDSNQSGLNPVTEKWVDAPRLGVSEYLRRFFSELDMLKLHESSEPTHAISIRDERICVLVSSGDFRVRVFVDDLDQDPSIAARRAFQLWQSRVLKDEDFE
jgi:hypothetical protein